MRFYNGDTMVTVYSDITLKMFEVLSDGQPHTAYEIADYADIPSAHVYSRLKPHFNIVKVIRMPGRINLYRMKENFLKTVSNIISRFRITTVAIARKIAKKLAGYKLDSIDIKVLQYLIEYMRATGKQWIEATSEEMSIAEMISKATGIRSTDVTMSLRNLIQIGIIAKYRRKLRITKSILR